MIRIILLSICFMHSLYVSANEDDKINVESCAGYKRQTAFQTTVPLGPEDLNHDITGDGIPDVTRRWGKYGTILTINCGDGTSYSPIYSHTGIWFPRSSSGEWSLSEFSSHPSTVLKESSEGRDYFTWIDGELYFFDMLGLLVDDLGDFTDDSSLPIVFNGSRYTSNLTYCKAFDVYGARLKIDEKGLSGDYPDKLLMLLKDGNYSIFEGKQEIYTYDKFKPQAINADKFIDGYLTYRPLHGTPAGMRHGTTEVALLNCGDDTYLYVPDHKLKDFSERAKSLSKKHKKLYQTLAKQAQANNISQVLATRDNLHKHLEGARLADQTMGAELDFKALNTVFSVANNFRKSGKKQAAANLLSQYLDKAHEQDELPLNLDDSASLPKQQAIHTRILNDTAFVLEQGDQPERALTLLQTVIERDPARAVAYLNIADTAKQLGNTQLEALGRIAHATLRKKDLADDSALALGCSQKPLSVDTNVAPHFLQLRCMGEGNKVLTTQWTKEHKIVTTKELAQ